MLINAPQVRRHPFFRPIDFVALERREIPAPYVPTITSPTDTSNFDFESDDSDSDFDDDTDDEDERASREHSLARFGAEVAESIALANYVAGWDTDKADPEPSEPPRRGSAEWDA